MTTEANTNHDNDASEFLLAAEKLAVDLEGDAQAEVISIIAARYAKLGLVDHAIELAETISDPFARNNAFAEIAAASITNGDDSDYAEALLEAIDDPGTRSVAIEEIAVQYAALGDVDKSLELASELDDADPALRRITLIAGTFSPRSIELALSITAPDLRCDTLGQLVDVALRADRRAEAALLLAESLRAAREIEFPESRIYALLSIASLYEKFGDTDRALEILSGALELCQSFEGQAPLGLSSSFPRGEALTHITESFARLRHFEQADLAAEQIEDPFQFAHASTKEAVEFFKAGQIDQALTSLSEALELVLDEPVYSEQSMLMKDSVLAELAVAFVIVGHLEKGLQVTEKLSSETQRFRALGEVGKECARGGNSRGVFQAAELITNNYSNTSYWLAITDVLRESAETELAHQTLLEAAKSARIIQNNYEKATSLIEVAYRFALLNDSAEASELFTLALVTITQLGQDDKKALSLLRIDERFRELNRKPNEEERQLLEQIEAG